MTEDINLKNFNINMFTDVLIPALDSHIKTGKNILGISDNPWGYRQNVIKNLKNLQTLLNNKMLLGILYEAVLQRKDILKTLWLYLNREHNIPLPTISYKEIINKEDYHVLFPDEYSDYQIRLHPDQYSPEASIEIKSSIVYVKEFRQKLAPYHYIQENYYVNHYNQKVGFLHKLNFRAFFNTFNGWDDLWNGYGLFIPIHKDIEAYELSNIRFKYMFEKIDTKDWYCPCPEQIFECSDCLCKDYPLNSKTKYCRNPITKTTIDFSIKCHHCKQDITLTKKASGAYTSLALERNGNYYHSTDLEGDGQYEACRQACKNDWRYDQDV